MSDMHSPRHAWKQLSKGNPGENTENNDFFLWIYYDLLQNYRWITDRWAIRAETPWAGKLISYFVMQLFVRVEMLRWMTATQPIMKRCFWLTLLTMP